MSENEMGQRGMLADVEETELAHDPY